MFSGHPSVVLARLPVVEAALARRSAPPGFYAAFWVSLGSEASKSKSRRKEEGSKVDSFETLANLNNRFAADAPALIETLD